MDTTIIILIVIVSCISLSISIGGGLGIFFASQPKPTTTKKPTTTPTSTTTTAAPTTTTAAPTTTTAAPTTTPYTGCWNCYLNSNKTRQENWNDQGPGTGGLCGYSQTDASNTCNAWISTCGNYGGCTAYKPGTTPP